MRAFDDRDQRRSPTLLDRKVESQSRQHAANFICLRMLGAKADERSSLSGSFGWMRRVAPVDEEWNNTVSNRRPRVCEFPRQLNAVGSPPASRSHFTKRHALSQCVLSHGLKIAASDEPRREPGFIQIIDAEESGPRRIRLIRIGCNYLEVCRRAESDNCVGGAESGMLTTACCSNAEEFFDLVDAAA
jgi:hypothetical protein